MSRRWADVQTGHVRNKATSYLRPDQTQANTFKSPVIKVSCQIHFRIIELIFRENPSTGSTVTRKRKVARSVRKSRPHSYLEVLRRTSPQLRGGEALLPRSAWCRWQSSLTRTAGRRGRSSTLPSVRRELRRGNRQSHLSHINKYFHQREVSVSED